MKTWSVDLEEDPDTGDVMLPLPPELLTQMGWTEGSELLWIDNQDGTFTIKEKKTENEIDTDVGC